VKLSGGNKGGKTGKNGQGREEEREEPGMVASVQVGYVDQMTRDRQKQVDTGV
jgi:hypothetical protein